MKNIHDAALDALMNDMDGIASNRMFSQDSGEMGPGATITISVAPGAKETDMDHDPETCETEGCPMCAGGMANEGTGMAMGGLADQGTDGEFEKGRPMKYARGGSIRMFR